MGLEFGRSLAGSPTQSLSQEAGSVLARTADSPGEEGFQVHPRRGWQDGSPCVQLTRSCPQFLATGPLLGHLQHNDLFLQNEQMGRVIASKMEIRHATFKFHVCTYCVVLTTKGLVCTHHHTVNLRYPLGSPSTPFFWETDLLICLYESFFSLVFVVILHIRVRSYSVGLFLYYPHFKHVGIQVQRG